MVKERVPVGMSDARPVAQPAAQSWPSGTTWQKVVPGAGIVSGNAAQSGQYGAEQGSSTYGMGEPGGGIGGMMPEANWRAAGFTGPLVDYPNGVEQGGQTSQALKDWLASNGYELRYGVTDGADGRITQLFKGDAPIGPGYAHTYNDDAFGYAMLAAGGLMGAYAAGAGAIGGTAAAGGGEAAGAAATAEELAGAGLGFGGGNAGATLTAEQLAAGAVAGGAAAPVGAEATAAYAANGVNASGSTLVPGALSQTGQFLKDNPGLVKGALGLGAAALAGGAGGGGVDTSGLQGLFAQSQKIAERQQGLAEEAYADLKASKAESDPIYKSLIANMNDQAATTGQLAKQQLAQYTSLFMPANEKLVKTAMEYDTPARRQAAAADARADVDASFARAQQGEAQRLARAGIAPGGAKSQALMGDVALEAAKAGAGASTKAIRDVESTGINLVKDAVGVGTTVANSGLNSASTSGSLSAGTGTVMAQKQAVNNQGLGAVSSLMNNAVSANNSAGNLYSNVAQIQAQNQAQKNAGLAGLGSLAGTLLTASKDSVLGSLIA